jgi:NAD(P)H-dependent FMN reductase
MSPRELLREKGTPYVELKLGEPHWTNDELISQILAHPILMNRPIVITPWGTELCRPSEVVLDILPLPQRGPLSKEDGEMVIDAAGRRVSPQSAAWSEGMVWTSPERHGAMTGIMKAQIDWIPLNVGSVRPTQGKTLAVMEVSGGSQSFNAVNQLRILGRWMRMITIPNQSSVAKAFLEFDEAGRMRPSAFYERVVDVMEQLMKFTLLTRDVASYLVDRYSERRESAEELSKRVSLRSL